MTSTDIIKDNWGDSVIRVFECEKFRKVAIDIPIFISDSIHKTEKSKNKYIYDIMLRVEDYLNNSGE